MVLPDGVAPASIVTKNGKIISIASYHADRKDLGVVDEYAHYFYWLERFTFVPK